MTRFRVALTGDFLKADGSMAFRDFDLTPLRSPTIEYAFIGARSPVDAGELKGFDALVLQGLRFTAGSIPAGGRLALVARFGVGFDSVDVAACTAAGIAVTNTPTAIRRPVAVSILTFMLALTGRLPAKDRLTREGSTGFSKRSQHMGIGLEGRTFASIGFGGIAQEAFRLLQPFGMRLIAYARRPDMVVARELGVEIMSLDEIFLQGDVVTVNCPLTRETEHLVNASRIAQMKPSAFLINTARGAIVDQAALTAALKEGRIAGAGLDVLEKEPPDVDDPILSLDNVLLAPHALCWTDQCFAQIGASALESVLAVASGRMPANLVDRTVVDKPEWIRRLAERSRRTEVT